ncbi:hypothetical protein E1B28_012613 [Marasmius oreades]|uniref:Transcription initiation factor TFIID subunit 4 n=1 Tax=Marasmius oreades TaxID=181124 RepID=A0A9P7RSW8_9AGAR|nr:uncharacterized protein E1B28_012613 [Marasmius oreades]KAG7088641.1 hypothetical protein E1B28_012613 [Marasmius oreades]
MAQPVKAEEPPMHSLTPTPSKPATPAPATAAPATPSPAGYWAIDPVLQAQSAQPGQTASGTYQYSYYPGYYQYHQQTQPTSGTPTPAPSTVPTSATNTVTAASNSNATNSNNAADSNDIATLNDALGSAGVDLRAEEESLQRLADTSSGYRSHLSYNSSYNQDRTRKQPPTPSFNTTFLGTTMRNIATTHKVTRVPEDSINYLALALRARLGDLVTSMVKAVKHRTDAQFDRPATMYPAPTIDPSKGGVIISEGSSQDKVDDSIPTPDPVPMWSIIIRTDVAKQLAAIEKVEREEETRVRKERKERADLAASHAAALAAQAAGNNPAGVGGDGEDGEAPKKKRKKDGPGVTARNMSEDVRKKMSNAVASQAAGIGGRYAWMTAANANAPPPPKKTHPTATSSISTTNTITPAQNSGSSTSWGKSYSATTAKKSDPPVDEDTRVLVTMRDAMFVISTERGHGGGRGSARGWT